MFAGKPIKLGMNWDLCAVVHSSLPSSALSWKIRRIWMCGTHLFDMDKIYSKYDGKFKALTFRRTRTHTLVCVGCQWFVCMCVYLCLGTVMHWILARIQLVRIVPLRNLKYPHSYTEPAGLLSVTVHWSVRNSDGTMSKCTHTDTCLGVYGGVFGVSSIQAAQNSIQFLYVRENSVRTCVCNIKHNVHWVNDATISHTLSQTGTYTHTHTRTAVHTSSNA